MLFTAQTAFGDAEASKELEYELTRQSDLFIKTITEGFQTIGDPDPALVRHEVLLAKTSDKKL